MTIQVPVYKEGLRAVISPTMVSLKAAIKNYEVHGGTANMFINEDGKVICQRILTFTRLLTSPNLTFLLADHLGMQAINPRDRERRKEFYKRNGIGWVARPDHNVDGYKRTGRQQLLLRPSGGI